MSAAVGTESAASTGPVRFAVVWLREVRRWCVIADDEPLTDISGNPLNWIRFSDAYDAKQEREQAARAGASSDGSSADRRLPAVGPWIVDTRTDHVAIVAGVPLGRLYLRRPGGGVEWEAMPVQVRPATEHEQLSAKVAEANLRSRAGGLE